jgi:hypothetical protein
MSTDLMQTFREAVQWFNNFDPKNWRHLEPLLHKDIRMKRIDDKPPSSYHVGRKAVEQYLCVGNGKADKAVFTPDEPPQHQEIGNYGFVSGTAIFKDPKGPKRLVYSFTYKRGDDPEDPREEGDYPKDAKNWQEIHSWGIYI